MATPGVTVQRPQVRLVDTLSALCHNLLDNNKKRRVSERSIIKWIRTVKRETGENPVRTRHCDQSRRGTISLGDREDFRRHRKLSVRRPARRCTGAAMLRATSNWLYALIDPRTAEDPFLRPLAAALVQRFFH